MKEKQLSDCKNVLIQLVDAYGEDVAYEMVKNLLPKPEPKYSFCLFYGCKDCRWVHSVTAHEDAIVIHLSEEPALISGGLNAIVTDLFHLEELKLPFSRYSSYSEDDYPQQEKLEQWREAIERYFEVHNSLDDLLRKVRETTPKLPAKYLKAIEEAQSSVPKEVSSDV